MSSIVRASEQSINDGLTLVDIADIFAMLHMRLWTFKYTILLHYLSSGCYEV